MDNSMIEYLREKVKTLKKENEELIKEINELRNEVKYLSLLLGRNV